MERTIDDLFVDDGGALDAHSGRPPVVFLHAAAGDTTHFSAQLAHLRGTRRALALDFRGHGRSAPPRDGDYSIAALAADVARVADAMNLGRFVLVGHSMGGAAAVAYAGAHGDRLAGLLLLDPASDGRALPAELRAGSWPPCARRRTWRRSRPTGGPCWNLRPPRCATASSAASAAPAARPSSRRWPHCRVRPGDAAPVLLRPGARDRDPVQRDAGVLPRPRADPPTPPHRRRRALAPPRRPRAREPRRSTGSSRGSPTRQPGHVTMAGRRAGRRGNPGASIGPG